MICMCVLLSAGRALAQPDIPLGSWRFHLSYNNIIAIELSAQNIFAATESGILVYHRQDQSLKTYSKINGLSSTGITSLAFDETRQQLLVGYEEGDLDIIGTETIDNFARLRDAEVTTSKKINHISIRGNLAYLSTAYGVVLFDLTTLEIRETWRDLGLSGGGLPVYESAFLNDSIYLASADGVLAGNPRDNLLDFNNWKRFNQGSFAGPIRSLVAFNNKLYATGPTGLYHLGNGAWLKEPFLDTTTIQSLAASDNYLLMIADSTIWLLDDAGQLSKLSEEILKAPVVAKQESTGNFWIGDRTAGLVSNLGSKFYSLLPNGPSVTGAHSMVYEDGKLYAVAGGFSASGEPLKIPGELNIFENGDWNTADYPLSDMTDIAFNGSTRMMSSFGAGVMIHDGGGGATFYNETNSPLVNTSGDASNITALSQSMDGLWVANYGGQKPLHLLDADGLWKSYSFGFANEQSPTNLAIDGRGNVWISLAPATGGGLIAFDPGANQGYYKNNVPGNGALPDRNVNCLTTDKDGYIWVGTDAGVAYFLSPTEDGIKPVYENRFLLRDEKITAIEIDAGNRKWIGTEQGVWLFDATAQTMLHYFTTENSPLPSNSIRDIEVHAGTGEVFFATDMGIVSYRGDAIAAGQKFEKLKIFPNPVSPGYAGAVGISGLTENAFVRITDISGKLIWQTQANGGMATWNVRDHQGRRAGTGIYLVFAVSNDGSESMVGKIAVVE